MESSLGRGNDEGKAYSGEFWLGAYQVVDPSIKKDNPNYARIGSEWATGEFWEDDAAQWVDGEPNGHYHIVLNKHVAMFINLDWKWNHAGAIGNISGYIAACRSDYEPSTVRSVRVALVDMAGLSRGKRK